MVYNFTDSHYFRSMSVAKEMFSRKRALPLLLIIVLLVVFYSRQPKPMMEIHGQTFGTIAYTIKYKDEQQRDFKTSIDSLLDVFNDAVSHYRPNSEISKFNKDSTVDFELPYLYPVLRASKEIYNKSNGAFNPAVMPLVNAWGFGPDKSMDPDSAMIDSLMSFTQFDLVEFDQHHAWKKDKRVQLDFSAVAKGQGVDIVLEFLQSKGIKDAFVEIGGEVNARGTNAHGKPWVVGILDPSSDVLNQSYIATVGLENGAVATSANNFNYVIRDGVRYTHTLDPSTGYPAHNPILSASVFANNCMTADAYATAFMVMGHEKAKEIVEKDPELEAFLIYSKPDGSTAAYTSKGLRNTLKMITNGN